MAKHGRYYVNSDVKKPIDQKKHPIDPARSKHKLTESSPDHPLIQPPDRTN